MAVINRKLLWEGRFLRAVLIDYRVRCNSSGEVEKRDWEAFERVNCAGVVGIVPFTRTGEVILIRQFRPPVNGHVVELPAGLVDTGEAFEDAVRRELVEETGYAAGTLHFLTAGPMSSGASSEILHVYIATDLTHVGVGERDETEDIEVLLVPVEDLAGKLEACRAQGDHVDLKVYGLTALAAGFLEKKAEG
ncbi:MAG: NUDIX hydrolase [Thermodesulfovibrionales bacterium]